MKRNTDLISKYKLDRYSPIHEDAILLHLDFSTYRSKKGSMVEATILALFSNQKELVIFYYLPVVGQRLSEITIQGKTYGCQFADADGFVHKYHIPLRFRAGTLKITHYAFLDDSLTRTTKQVHEEHVFGIYDNQYFYDSKRYFTIELVGELFHEVIDMTTIQDKFYDVLGRLFLYKDVANIKSRFLKLYYVAFNLFDHEKQHYFVPEDILEMRVKYDELRYVYQATLSDKHEKINPRTAGETITTPKKEIVKKEPRLIESGEKSAWNMIQNFFTYKAYQFDSIYKISNQVKIDRTETKNYTYALVIGQKLGYRLSEETFQRGKKYMFDFDITTLKNIAIYNLTYQQKGHRYAVPVASMVYESDKKSQLPRLRNRFKRVLKQILQTVVAPFKFIFGAGGVLIKMIRFILRNWKVLIVLIILGLIIYLGVQLNGVFQWI